MTDVLIAGAGFAGLVLACDLARRGVDFRIVDANPEPPDHRAGSRGKGIQPRTLEIYDDLGVIDAVRAAGGPYSPAMAWDGPTQVGPAKFHRIEAREPTPDVPYPSMWMLPQPRALDILRARLKALGGAVEFGVKVVALTPMGSLLLPSQSLFRMNLSLRVRLKGVMCTSIVSESCRVA